MPDNGARADAVLTLPLTPHPTALPAARPRRRVRRRIEEVANASTHAVGAVLSVIGLGVLLWAAAAADSLRGLICLGIYGLSLITLYGISATFHATRRMRLRAILHRWDHIAIYLLIAGTYTPLSLMMVRGVWGWSLGLTIWVLAIVGIVFKLLWHGTRFPRLTIGLYLTIGWVGLLAVIPLATALPAGSLMWLVMGALIYSTGIIFYLWHRLPFGHAIWHTFVMGGSACHYVAVLLYALPG